MFGQGGIIPRSLTTSFSHGIVFNTFLPHNWDYTFEEGDWATAEVAAVAEDFEGLAFTGIVMTEEPSGTTSPSVSDGIPRARAPGWAWALAIA